MSKGRGGIVIRSEWIATLRTLSNEEKGAFLDCLFKHIDGEPLTDIPEGMAVFVDFTCRIVDDDRANYQEISEKRSAAGKSGGAKSGKARQRKKNGAESQTVGETQPESSYDIDTFTEVAMKRSFEDCG